MYIVIKNIEVRGANALSAYPVVSGISPLAISGFVRNVMLKMKVDHAENLEFAVVHHEGNLRAEELGYGVLPHQKIGALLTCSSANKKGSTDYVSGSMNLALQPIIECDALLSIIINIKELNIPLEWFSDEVPALRISGGQIQSLGKVVECQDITSAFQACDFGYVYSDQSARRLSVGFDERVQAFTRSVYPVYLDKESNEKKTYDALGATRVVPFNLGWLPLSDFKETDGARLGFLHAYAEPLVGLVGLFALKRDLHKKEPLMWSMKKKGPAYVVTSVLGE